MEEAGVIINEAGDAVCVHGTAMDVHCCNCHSGFLFDDDKCVCIHNLKICTCGGRMVRTGPHTPGLIIYECEFIACDNWIAKGDVHGG